MRTLGYWRRFFRAMSSRKIVCNALKVSVVVGTALNLINQGEYLMAGQGLMMGNVALNYLVPFCVSAWSGARALPIHEPGSRHADAREPES